MNQTFSLTRFARLHRWLWATKARTYLISLAALFILMCLLLSRVMSDDLHRYDASFYRQHHVFFSLFELMLTVSIASDVFSMLFRQESAITYLMLPASRTEKFWLGTSYCVAAIGLFTAIFFGYEAIAFKVANSHLSLGETHYVSSLIFQKQEVGLQREFYLLAYMLPAIVSIALLGSFFFRRGVLVRNVGALLVVFLGLVFLNKAIVGTQFRGFEQDGDFPFQHQYVSNGGHGYELYSPDWLMYAVYGFLLLALWVIARIRFNEIER